MVLMSGLSPRERHGAGSEGRSARPLGALVAVGAATASLRRTVQLALAAGASEAEIVGVLIAVAPTVGLARVVATAPKLATAIGYDVASDE